MNICHILNKHNMSRINRRDWIINKKIKILGRGGITDLFDNQFKFAYRVTDDEFDHICDVATDDELNVLIEDKPTFGEKRRMIEILNKHVVY